MPQVQTITKEQVEEPKLKTYYTSGIILAIVLAIIFIGSYVGVMTWERITENQITKIEDQTKNIKRKLDNEDLKTKVKIAQDLQKQLKNLKTLINNHVFASELLAEIERRTLGKVAGGNIYFTDFAADLISLEVNLSGRGKNFEAAAQQIASFRNSSFIEDLFVKKVSVQQDEVTRQSFVGFEADFKIKKELILPSLRRLMEEKVEESTGENVLPEIPVVE